MYPDFSYEDVDIWCFNISKLNQDIVDQVYNHHKEPWIYISSPMPPYPNFVIDTEALDYRIVPWICWKYDIKGLLYWSVNRWSTNPWDNPMNFYDQNGNGFLYYPLSFKLVPSLRLEVLRDGLEDYEYLYLLSTVRDKLEGDTKEIDDLSKCRGLISSPSEFLQDPDSIYNYRQKIAEYIEKAYKSK